jgi:Tfp pilus assembly protein PilX
MKKKALLKQDGVVIIFSLVIMVSLIVVVASYVTLVSYSTKTAGIYQNKEEAFYNAEAGLNRAVWYLENTAPDASTNGSWRTTAYPADPGVGATDPQQEIFENGTYTMWVETSGSDILITSRGIVNSMERIVRQTVSLVIGTPNIVTSVTNSWTEI